MTDLCDVLVVCTIPGTEKEPTLAAFGISPGLEPDNNHICPLWLTDIDLKGAMLRVAIACIGDQGTGAASSHTARLLDRYSPNYAFLVGTCAGLKEKTKTGDVIGSREILGYGAKRIENEADLDQPEYFKPPYALWRKYDDFDSLKSRNDWEKCRRAAVSRLGMDGLIDDSLPQVHKALIASGDYLLAADNALDKVRARFHEKIRGAEKEAAGFAGACWRRRTGEIPWLVFKGVSDSGGTDKNNQLDEPIRQRVATLNAATFLRTFISKGIDWPNVEDYRRKDRLSHRNHNQFERLRLRLGFVEGSECTSTTFGEEAWNAFDLARADGELEGVGIDMDMLREKDEGDPDKSAKIVKRLIKAEKVCAIIGPTNSGCAVRARDLAHDYHCLVLSPSATASKLTADLGEGKKWFLSMQSPNSRTMGILAQHFWELSLNRVLVIYENYDKQGNEDLYGKDAWDDICAALKAHGIRSNGVGYTRGLSLEEARALIEQGRILPSDKPDALVLITLESDLAVFAEAKKSSSLKRVPLYLPNFKSSLLHGDPRLFSGTRLLVSFYSDDPDWYTSQFVARYRSKIGSDPTPLSAATYDGTTAILRSIRELADVVRFRESRATLTARRAFIREWVHNIRFQGTRDTVTFDECGTSGARLRLVQLGRRGYGPVGK